MTTTWRRSPPEKPRHRSLRKRLFIRPIDRWRSAMYLSEVAWVYSAICLLEGGWWYGTGVLFVGLALRLYSGGYR